MQDVSNLRQVLVQTQAVQRTQENARRRGELQQQQIAKKLGDRVDIQGRHVEESPESAEAKVDPDAQREKEEPQAQQEGGKKQDAKPPAAAEAARRDKPPDDEPDKGTVIDVRA